MSDEIRTVDTDPTLHLEREYDATPAEVWDAWTDPERLTRWLAPPAGPLGPEPVRLTFGAGSDGWADLTVRESDPPRRLELLWEFAGGVASVLRVQIDEVGPGRSRVTIDHRGLGRSTAGYGAGWTAYLVGLGAELGAPSDSSWDQLFAAALPGWQRRIGA